MFSTHNAIRTVPAPTLCLVSSKRLWAEYGSYPTTARPYPCLSVVVPPAYHGRIAWQLLSAKSFTVFLWFPPSHILNYFPTRHILNYFPPCHILNYFLPLHILNFFFSLHILNYFAPCHILNWLFAFIFLVNFILIKDDVITSEALLDKYAWYVLKYSLYFIYTTHLTPFFSFFFNVKKTALSLSFNFILIRASSFF